MYKGYNCRVEYAVSLIKGKWKPIILSKIYKNNYIRYNELSKSIIDISHKVLTEKLRELETDQLILKDFNCNSLYSQYKLTKEGEEMYEILNLMKEWVVKNEGR